MGNFERIRYPDGQISAKWVPGKYDSNPLARRRSDSILKQRINSYEDLFFIRSCAELLHSQRVTGWTLFVPCMFGQRSDRRFDPMQSFDLKLIADVINQCKFDQVEILDPHSDVTMALIENPVKRSSFQYVEKAIKHYHDWNAAHHNGTENPILISPDAGAYKKIFDYGEKLGLEVVAAVKHRDTEGKVDLKFIGDVKNKPCFIVDDLCDGGYTFLVLADELRKRGAKEVYLYVTHGIFSKGFGELHKQINHIYCTNSVKDISVEDKNLLEAYPFLPNLVTQFKVI